MTPNSSTQIPPSITETLNKLNNWDSEELDIYECPSRHPNYEPAGETGGWIFAHKQKLSDEGVFVRWNCERKIYEITQEENQTALCGCK